MDKNPSLSASRILTPSGMPQPGAHRVLDPIFPFLSRHVADLA
jgi:hypothetical protein